MGHCRPVIICSVETYILSEGRRVPHLLLDDRPELVQERSWQMVPRGAGGESEGCQDHGGHKIRPASRVLGRQEDYPPGHPVRLHQQTVRNKEVRIHALQRTQPKGTKRGLHQGHEHRCWSGREKEKGGVFPMPDDLIFSCFMNTWAKIINNFWLNKKLPLIFNIKLVTNAYLSCLHAQINYICTGQTIRSSLWFNYILLGLLCKNGLCININLSVIRI